MKAIITEIQDQGPEVDIRVDYMDEKDELMFRYTLQPTKEEYAAMDDKAITKAIIDKGKEEAARIAAESTTQEGINALIGKEIKC